MAKIVGDTTVTPMPVPDLAQTDKRKADYIKNKKISFLENDIGYAEKAYVDNKVGEIDEALESFIDKTKVTMHFLNVDNTLHTAKINTWMTWAEAIETEEVKALGMGFTIGDDGYVRCYISAFLKEADYEGDVSASTFPTWCIKGTDKVKDGQVYTSSGVYEMDIPSANGGTWKKLVDITTTEEVNEINVSHEDFPKCKEFIVMTSFQKSSTGANVSLGASRIDLHDDVGFTIGFFYSTTTINASANTENRCHIFIADGLVFSVGTADGAAGTGQIATNAKTLIGERRLNNDVTKIRYYLSNAASLLFPIGTKFYVYGKVEG